MEDLGTAHEQPLAHLRLLANSPGFWEVRALRRVAGSRMMPRGSFWIVATAMGPTGSSMSASSKPWAGVG
jgi:hypothetical protein